MKIKRLGVLGLTLILSLFCGLCFISMQNKSMLAIAADEVKYNQYMLVEGNPKQLELAQPAGSMTINGQEVESSADLSYKFVLGQKDIVVSSFANQGFVLKGWYVLYEEDSLTNFMHGTTNGYISITDAEQIINNGLIKINPFETADKQASLQIVEMFENIKIAPVFDYQYFNVTLKGVNNFLKEIGSYKYGDNVAINEDVDDSYKIDALEVVSTNEDIDIEYIFTTGTSGNTTAYSANFVMNTYEDVVVELKYDNLYKVDLKLFLGNDELTNFESQEFKDLYSCLTIKNDEVWDDEEENYIVKERFFKKLNDQGTSFFVKQNKNFEISLLNNFKNANGYIYYNFVSLDNSASNLTANYNSISADKIVEIKYAHNTFKVDFVGVLLNNDRTVQATQTLAVPASVNDLTRVSPDLELTETLLQTNVGYSFEGFAKYVVGKTEYTEADLNIAKVSLNVDSPENLIVYLVYTKTAYTINLTGLTSVSLTNATLETPQLVYPIASAKVGNETKTGTSISFGSFYIDDVITMELTLNKGFILNSVSSMTKADESKEVYTLLLDADYLNGKGTTIDLAINAELQKYTLTYRIGKYKTSAMADINVQGYNITETLVEDYYQIVVGDLTYYQTVTLESKANGTGTDGEYYLFKWFTTDFKSTITSGLDNDEGVPPKYFIPFTIYGDSVVYVVYSEPTTQLEIRINTAPDDAGITFVVNQEGTTNSIPNTSGLYSLNQNKLVTIAIRGLESNANLFGYKYINTELYTTNGEALTKVADSELVSTSSYSFTPTSGNVYVVMINIQKIEYVFNITSNTSFSLTKTLTVEDTLLEFEKPVGYYVGKVMIQNKDTLEYEEYSNMNQNNSSRNGQIVDGKNLFEKFTYTISTTKSNVKSEFEQIIENYGIGTTNIVVNMQLTFNIYQYEVNLKYYKFTNDAVENTTGVKITYPTVQLTYTLGETVNKVAEYENLPSEIKFKYIPYGADVKLNVVRGVSAGFEMKGWYDYNAAEKLVTSSSLTDQEKLLQYSMTALTGDYKLSYRVDYIHYTIKLNYTEGQGNPLVNEQTTTVVKMGEKVEVALNARMDKGFMGYSVNYIQPVYTKYEFTTAEQFANDYKSLVIIKNGYVYSVLSNVYDERVEYYTVSSETVEKVLTTYTDNSFDVSNYVAEGNVINFELEYVPIEMKIKNVSQTIAKLDAFGNVMYEALNLEKAGLTADQIATYTITAENGGVTRPIAENSDIVTVDDIITIGIKINEVTSADGNTYKLYKGLDLYTYALTNNWNLTCETTGEGSYKITFAVANNIKVEFAEKGLIEINYGYQQKSLRTVTATSNMANYSNFFENTELNINMDGKPAISDKVGSISMTGNFLSGVKVSLDLKSLKDHFVINSITAYAGSTSNKIIDLDDYYINPKKSGLLISHVELTMFDADIIIQFNVQPRLYLEGTEITIQTEYIFNRTYAIDNEGNGVAQTFTLGSELSNDISGYGINSSTMKIDVYKNGVLQTYGAINASEEEYVLKLALKNSSNTDSWLYYIGELPCVIKLKINPLNIKLQYELNSQVQKEYSASSEYNIKFVKVGNNLQSEDGKIVLKGVANKSVFNLGLLTFNSQISANIVMYNDKGELVNQKYVTSNYAGIFITGLKLQNNNNFVLQLNEYICNSESCQGVLIESFVQIVPKVVNILNLEVYDKVWNNNDANAKFGLVDGAIKYELDGALSSEDEVSVLSDEIKVYFVSRPITQYDLQTKRIDEIIKEIKSGNIAEGKYVIVDARTALTGAQKANYVVGDFRVGVVNYKETKTIYPYTISTTIKGIGNVIITNKRGLKDYTKANLIPVKATLSVERIEDGSAEYREIYSDISSFLSRRNVFAAGYKLSIIDKNGTKTAVNNELYLTLPSETNLNNVISLSGDGIVKIDYKTEGGNIVIDLSQIEEEVSYIVMIQNRSLLEAWQIILIVGLSLLFAAGIGVAVFFIVKKRKMSLDKYDTI